MEIINRTRIRALAHVLAGMRALLPLGVSFVISGCLVGPDFKKPQTPIATDWNTHDKARLATETATASQWWKELHDPALDRLIELAFQQNLPLQIAGLRIVEARAQLGIATGKQFPQVQEMVGSVMATGITKPQAERLNVGRNFGDYQVGFDAIWEIDLWGKYRRGVEASTASLLATVTDYYSALVSLTAEVARTYATMRTFEVLVAQAQENAQLQEVALRIAEARYNNGATSELDVTQATTLYESTRATIPRLEISAYQARNALATLMGRPPGTIEDVLAGPKEIPSAPPRVAISVPAEMLRRRPDIHSAELYAAAQCARIGVAKAELYPSFTLFGSIGLQTFGGVGVPFISADSLAYSFGPRISLPFLNYGRLTNNVRVEDARFQELLVNYRSTVLRAAQEVEDALTGFVHSQQAVEFEVSSLASAQRSQELAVLQYQEGSADYERVLDSQRALLQRQNELAQTRSDAIVSLIALYKALGGGWQVRQGQPVVAAQTQEEMKHRTDWGDLLSEPRSPEHKANQPQDKH